MLTYLAFEIFEFFRPVMAWQIIAVMLAAILLQILRVLQTKHYTQGKNDYVAYIGACALCHIFLKISIVDFIIEFHKASKIKTCSPYSWSNGQLFPQDILKWNLFLVNYREIKLSRWPTTDVYRIELSPEIYHLALLYLETLTGIFVRIYYK